MPESDKIVDGQECRGMNSLMRNDATAAALLFGETVASTYPVSRSTTVITKRLELSLVGKGPHRSMAMDCIGKDGNSNSCIGMRCWWVFVDAQRRHVLMYLCVAAQSPRQ